MKRTYILLLLLFSFLNGYSEKISIKITAPKEVGVGEEFTIEYEIGTTEISNFQPPTFEGFSVVDTRRSSSSSTSIINGQRTYKSSTNIIYVLRANNIGSFTIEPATFILQGEVYKSRSIPIKVSKGQHGGTGQNSSSSTYSRPDNKPQPKPVLSNKGNENLLIRAIASKTRVYEQEAILLTYKIYANADVSGFQGKLPVLNGFHIQELDPSREQKTETLNGIPYMTAIWKQYVLYPQSAGTFEIPPIECEAQVRTIREDYSDPFGFFFPRYETTTKRVSSLPIKIDVKPLPEAPSTFSGAVGSFNVSSSINKRKLNAGDVVSIKLKVKGTGNLKLIEAPQHTFPSSFETYDCKVSDNYEITSEGHSGTKTFEYPIVPREGGHFNLSPLEFTYFDTNTHKYKTLKTSSYSIDVTGNSSMSSPSDIDELNQDIKYIKTGDVDVKSDNTSQLFSWKWGLAYGISLICFIIALIYRNKLFNTVPTSSEEKRRRANKMAQKKLQNAKTLLENNEKSGFYEEVLNSLYSFVQNKLNIENEQFNKENVISQFASHSVSQSIIDEYMLLIDECEIARFSPTSTDTSMDDVYKKALTVINDIDSAIK